MWPTRRPSLSAGATQHRPPRRSGTRLTAGPSRSRHSDTTSSWHMTRIPDMRRAHRPVTATFGIRLVLEGRRSVLLVGDVLAPRRGIPLGVHFDDREVSHETC